MAGEPGAIVIPSPFHWNGREGQTPKWIIIHGTAGGTSAQAIGNWFQNPEAQASTNYIVGTDGVIVQSVDEDNAPYANGFVSGASGVSGNGYGNGFHDSWWDSGINPNLLTISIEHVKSAEDNSNPLTDAQKQASFTLVQHICERNNIPMRKADVNGGITGHYSIDPINRSRCPGDYPWNDLWQFLGQGGDATVLTIDQASKYFTEMVKDTRWHCPKTNQDIAYGILTYYRSCTGVALNGLSQYGLPVSGEESVPNTKSAVLQRFERGVILFDPANEVDSVPGLPGPCYPAHIDKLPGQDPRIAPLQAEIATLQHQNAPTTPVVTVNTAQAISSIQASIAALQSALHTLEPS